MNIKNLTIPTLIGLSVLFGACAEPKIETPDSSSIEEGIEGIEQGAEDATDAIKSGVQDLEKNVEDATGAIQDGVKNLEKGAEDATNATTDAVKKLGE